MTQSTSKLGAARPTPAKCEPVEMCWNGLQHSHSLPFSSVHSRWKSHSHDPSDLIPIPVPLPKFIPIPFHSHSRLTNKRHLSLNKCSKYRLSTVSKSQLASRDLTSFFVFSTRSGTCEDNEYDLVAHRWHQTGHIVHPSSPCSVSRPMGILSHVKK